MNVHLMNKVRKLNSITLYEILEYDIRAHNMMQILTVTPPELDQYFSDVPRDFEKREGFLLSLADMTNSGLFKEPEVQITFKPSIYDLLIELVRKNGFFIPYSLYETGKEYKGEETSHFSNIRVSSSSMYVGFSIYHDGSWFASKILSVENGQLEVKPFYMALPCEQTLESCQLERVGTSVVNGKECNIYLYEGQLPIVPSVSPGLYMSLPLLNYLNLQYCRCANSLNFFKDIFDLKGISVSEKDHVPPAPTRAITIKASISNSSKQRRAELTHYHKYFTGSLEEFVAAYKLNALEHYTFVLISRMKTLTSVEDIFKFMKLLRVSRSEYSLVLMMLRSLIFRTPEVLFPASHFRVIARGGGGGDVFTTSIETNNY